ncbi:MAG: hypothetical protein PVG86_05295 [Desulfobacterales bacterium]
MSDRIIPCIVGAGIELSERLPVFQLGWKAHEFLYHFSLILECLLINLRLAQRDFSEDNSR